MAQGAINFPFFSFFCSFYINRAEERISFKQKEERKNQKKKKVYYESFWVYNTEYVEFSLLFCPPSPR